MNEYANAQEAYGSKHFHRQGQFHGDVYPNIDCALIVGITVILDEIKHAQSSSTRGGGR